MSQSAKNPGTPRSIQQRVSTQRVGHETLLYDERRHQAFCLNRSSSVIWRLANGERTVAEMSVAASLELETPVSEEFVLFALEQMRMDGLVEPSKTAEVGPGISRRTMLKSLGAGGALLLPAIASIVAPTAAQAYSGCVDCSIASPSVKAQRMARAKRQSLNGSDNLGPVNNNGSIGTFSPYTTPAAGQRVNKPQ